MIGKRIKYWILNSWNECYTELAYNVKIYNIFPSKYQNKLYDLLFDEDISQEIHEDYINPLIQDFEFNHKDYIISFNGRSGGYLICSYRHNNYNVYVKDTPPTVLKDFRRLAIDIYNQILYLAKNATIEQETYLKECSYNILKIA